MYSTQGDCAHVKGWPRLTQGNEGLAAKLREGLVAKLRMGWEPLGSHPIRHLCCLFSNLSTLALQLCMPLNSVFRRLLPVSPAFHPLSLRLSPTNAPSPHSLFLAYSFSFHPSNLLLSNPDPSPALQLIPRSSASVR